MTNSATAAASGWYPDPSAPRQLRWWDGTQWTSYVRPQFDSATPPQAPGGSVEHEPQTGLDSSHPTTATKHLIRRRELAELFPDGDYIFETATDSAVREHFTRSRAITTIALALAGLLLVKVGWGTLATDNSSDATIYLPLGIVLPFVPYLLLRASLKKRMIRTWAQRRGFAAASLDLGALQHQFPLFQIGTRRRLDHVMSGMVGGHKMTVAQYHAGYDDDDVPTFKMASGNTTIFADYTIAVVELPESVAERFVGISLCRESDTRTFEQGAEVPEVESIDFERKLKIVAAPAQDPIAVRELFGPQLIVALTQHPVCWEQRGSTLIVYGQQLDDTTTPLDAICVDATFVLEHYLTEQQ